MMIVNADEYHQSIYIPLQLPNQPSFQTLIQPNSGTYKS